MSLLIAEAQKLSNNSLERGVIEEIIDREDLFAVLPFMPINGKAYVYNQENTLSEADFLSPNDTVNEGSSTFTEVTTTLSILAGDVDVDKFLQTTMSDTNDQKAIQIAGKAKGLARAFRRNLAQGDTSVNSKAFNGVAKINSDSNQSISAGTNGNALTLSMLDTLMDTVPLGADFLMMRLGTIRALRALLRASGGNHAMDIMVPEFGAPMLMFNGIPVIRNEFLPLETAGSNSNTCSIYAIRANLVDGLHGIYGGPNAGIVVEDIGTVQNKDATRTRLKWYSSVVLKSTRSLGRLTGVTNI